MEMQTPGISAQTTIMMDKGGSNMKITDIMTTAMIMYRE